MIGSTPARPRWWNLPGLVVANLVPLFLVLQGLMVTADLLLSYLFELYVLLALWLLQRRRPQGSLADHLPSRSFTRRQHVALWIVPAVVVIWLSWSVFAAVSWDPGTALAVAAMGVSIAVSLVLSLRDAPRGVTTGAWLWRMLLLATGAWVGLGTAENYTLLQSGGWDPAPLGSGWAMPFGRAMAEAGLALGVSAAVVPVLFVVLVRTLNEVLYESYDILRDADVDRQASRDALTTMHAERQRQHERARQGQHDADQGR